MYRHLIIAFGWLLLAHGTALAGDPSFKASLRFAEGSEWGGGVEAPDSVTWRTTIAPPDEPGERLVITGTVYQEDGKAPAKDVIFYAYHTNAQGVYPKRAASDGRLAWRHGVLRGWMRTGADGRYELHTIRPAPYPGGQFPAHIHVTLTAPGYPEYWIEDFVFEGDPLLTDRDRAGHGRSGFPHVLRLERGPDGAWHGTRDIRLKSGLRE